MHPTAWSSCRPVPLFAHNRNIRVVRYHFDSAPPVDQTFTADATLQTIPLDVVTTKVTIEIVATELPGGSNVDDTLISETAFYGVNAGGSGPGPGADSAATTPTRPDPGPPRCLDDATATTPLRKFPEGAYISPDIVRR